MAIQAIRGAVEAAIQRASRATGVDFGFLMKTAARESGFNPSARASTSSAAGLFQFIEQTWLATLKQHGAKHGLGQYARLIEKSGDGRYRVGGDEARRAVMNLRFDSHAASLMAGELAADHAAYLRGRVGREPTGGELYAAHFLGPQGSAKLIEAVNVQPGASAARLFPEAAQANRSIFYNDGRPATVSEVYANLTRTGGKGGAVGAPKESGLIQYANAGDARQTEAALLNMLLGDDRSGGFTGAFGGGGGAVGGDWAGSLLTSEMLKMLSDARDKA